MRLAGSLRPLPVRHRTVYRLPTMIGGHSRAPAFRARAAAHRRAILRGSCTGHVGCRVNVVHGLPSLAGAPQRCSGVIFRHSGASPQRPDQTSKTRHERRPVGGWITPHRPLIRRRRNPKTTWPLGEETSRDPVL